MALLGAIKAGSGILPFSAYSSSASWMLPVGHWVAAVKTLQLIAPRTGIGANSRYSRAYTGLQWRVPVGVQGGAYPYQYSISGPSGMTVGQHYGDTDYGVINWPTPVAGTTSYTVTVTDQQGNTDSATVTLVVGTANFIVIDGTNGHHSSNNGGSGTGTLANPFLDMSDFYNGTSGSGAGTRFDTTYQNYHVIYRTGTYDPSVCYTDSNGLIEFGAKPPVHIPYPGESVSFDFQSGVVTFSTSADNICMNNITVLGLPRSLTLTANMAWRIDGGGTDYLFFENTLQTPAGAAINGTNPAFIMFADSHPSIAQYILFKDNTIQGDHGYDVVLGYYTKNFLAEGNSLSNCSGHGFYSKIGNDTFELRANTGIANNTGTLVEFDGYSPASATCLVSYNNYKSSFAGVQFGPNTGGTVTPVYLVRNTWQIPNHEVDNVPVGVLQVINDVNQYTNASATAHGWLISGGSISTPTYSGEECVGLNGGFVDSSGNLTGANRTAYLGIRGQEVA